MKTYGHTHNRNIWPSATERQTIETYGRHAWPILLSVLVSPLYTLLICMHVCICICVCMCVYVCVYVCMYAYMYMYVCIIYRIPLAFADDIDLIEEDALRLEETTRALNEEGKRYGLNMNFEKTKTMVFGEKEPTGKLLIHGRHLDNVEQFTYLGSNTTYDLDNMREVRTRLAKATAALKAMEKVWKSRSIEI